MTELNAIFDIDGTLVDTNYQHALAWYRAFRQHGIVMPIWRIHRAIGIGSDRVVELLAGERVEKELGDALRDAQGPLYNEMIDEVEPMEGAHDLLRDLKKAGHPVILASSAKEEEAERYIDLLDARDFVDGLSTTMLCRGEGQQARARHRRCCSSKGRRWGISHDRRQHLGLQSSYTREDPKHRCTYRRFFRTGTERRRSDRRFRLGQALARTPCHHQSAASCRWLAVARHALRKEPAARTLSQAIQPPHARRGPGTSRRASPRR